MAKSDEQTVLELHHRFAAANKVADSRFLRAHMAPGSDTLIWYNLNQSNYIGVDHIVELWDMLREAMGGKTAVVETRDERVTVVGDVALVTYLLHLEADFGPLGKFAQDGRDTEVWQRMNGEWKMIHFHCSNYVPGVMGGK
ncbi:MAG: YybH family protein [Candidatus Binatia bacterium]